MKQYLKQSSKLLLSHVIIDIIALVFLPAFGWLFKKDNVNGMAIYSWVVSIIYFLIIYSDAWEFGYKDNRPYHEIRPYPLKGLVLGAMASVVSLVLVVLFYISATGVSIFQTQVAEGHSINIMNIIYRVWMMPFTGFFGNSGEENLAMCGLVILVLPVASFLGYWAGMHEFSIQQKLYTLINAPAVKEAERKKKMHELNKKQAK